MTVISDTCQKAPSCVMMWSLMASQRKKQALKGGGGEDALEAAPRELERCMHHPQVLNKPFFGKRRLFQQPLHLRGHVQAAALTALWEAAPARRADGR